MGRSGAAARATTIPPARSAVDADVLIGSLHVDQNMTPAAIAEHLTRAGVPAPRGVAWSQVTVERRLKRAGVFRSRLDGRAAATQRAISLRLEHRPYDEIATLLAAEGFSGLRGVFSPSGVRELIAAAAASGDSRAQQALELAPAAPRTPGTGRPRVVSREQAKRIADDYLRTEKNAALLAKIYTEEGRPAPHGGQVWYTGTITDILRSVDVELLPPGWIPDEAVELIRRRKQETPPNSKDENGKRRKVNDEIVAELNDLGIVANRHGERWNAGRLARAIKRLRLFPSN